MRVNIVVIVTILHLPWYLVLTVKNNFWYSIAIVAFEIAIEGCVEIPVEGCVWNPYWGLRWNPYWGMSEIFIEWCAISLLDDYRNQQAFFDNVLLLPIEDDGGS